MDHIYGSFLVKVKKGFKGYDFDSQWEESLTKSIDELGLNIQYQAPTITYKAQVFNDTKHKKYMELVDEVREQIEGLRHCHSITQTLPDRLAEVAYEERKYTFDFVYPPAKTAEEILANPENYRLVEAKGFIRKNQRGLNARDKMKYFKRSHPELNCYFMPQKPKAKYSPKMSYMDLGKAVGFTSITEEEFLKWK